MILGCVSTGSCIYSIPFTGLYLFPYRAIFILFPHQALSQPGPSGTGAIWREGAGAGGGRCARAGAGGHAGGARARGALCACAVREARARRRRRRLWRPRQVPAGGEGATAAQGQGEESGELRQRPGAPGPRDSRGGRPRRAEAGPGRAGPRAGRSERRVGPAAAARPRVCSGGELCRGGVSRYPCCIFVSPFSALNGRWASNGPSGAAPRGL